ncbi:MAG: hypothetical protein JNL71_18350 [Rhodospirillales bacterium]|nr:hypothetical protein [Rhodospirillales bacterium]
MALFSRKESFEVHCLKENRWIIETSIPSQTEAEAYARKLLEKKEVLGVKVIREREGRSSSSEAVVFSKVKEKKEEKVTIGQIDSSPVCQSANDCCDLPARMALNRLFRQYLDKQNLTPIEILHNYREIKRVQDADSLMTSAVGQLATLQAASGPAAGTVIQRRDALYGFLGELTKRAKDVESLPLPSIKQLGVDQTFAKIAPGAGDDPENANYLFRVAVSRELIDIRSYLGKLDRALMWVEDSQDDEAARRLDDFVCDVLGTSSVIQDLLGEQPSLMAAITKLLDLAQGRWEAPPPGAGGEAAAAGEEDRMAKIGRLIAGGRLPNCGRVLIERVRLQLAGANPLVRSDPEQEVPSFRTLLDRLVPENDAIFGGTDMVDALVQRKMRILNRGGAAGYRAAAAWICMVMINPVRKTRFMVALTQTPTGQQYPEETFGLIDDVLVKVESISDIVKARVPPNEKMAGITLVWNEIRKAPLPLDHVERICTRLDDLLVHYVKSERILEKIDDPARPLRMRTMMLMKMCLPTSLPPGKASNLAREIIVGMLKRQNFENEVVADITDPTEKARAQRDLFVLMRQAGFM